MKTNCGDCIFFRLTFFIGESGERGVCHRFPPKVVLLAGKLISDLPRVHPLDWCGEFKEKVKAKEK